MPKPVSGPVDSFGRGFRVGLAWGAVYSAVDHASSRYYQHLLSQNTTWLVRAAAQDPQLAQRYLDQYDQYQHMGWGERRWRDLKGFTQSDDYNNPDHQIPEDYFTPQVKDIIQKPFDAERIAAHNEAFDIDPYIATYGNDAQRMSAHNEAFGLDPYGRPETDPDAERVRNHNTALGIDPPTTIETFGSNPGASDADRVRDHNTALGIDPPPSGGSVNPDHGGASANTSGASDADRVRDHNTALGIDPPPSGGSTNPDHGGGGSPTPDNNGAGAPRSNPEGTAADPTEHPDNGVGAPHSV